MSRKRIGAPILLTLIGVLICGSIWGYYITKDDAELDRHLKSIPDGTIYKAYVLRHYRKYPDCKEHEAVFADAKRHAAWYIADQKHVKKYRKLMTEFNDLTDESIHLFEKYNYRPAYEATHIPEAERLKDMERIKALMAEIEAHDERSDALNREKPIYPKLTHTH